MGHAGREHARTADRLRRDHGLRRRDAPRPGRGAPVARGRDRLPAARARRRGAAPRRLPRRPAHRARRRLVDRPGPRWARSAGTRSSSRRRGSPTRSSGRPFPPRFDAFQWHYYTWELPLGAELLAANGAARQAYRLGERTWAVQFHPEVNAVMLDHWFTLRRVGAPGPQGDVSGRRPRPSSRAGWSRGNALVGGVPRRKRRKVARREPFCGCLRAGARRRAADPLQRLRRRALGSTRSRVRRRW